MDPQRVTLALANWSTFHSRIESLDEAIYNRLDETDDLSTETPGYFSTTDRHRRTFHAVITEEFCFRRSTHLMVILEYQDELESWMDHDFHLLHSDSIYTVIAVERWENWEAVAKCWPFAMPTECPCRADALEQTCRDMWNALRIVAEEALLEEARVGYGKCIFNVAVKGGVERRLQNTGIVTMAMGYLRERFGLVGS